MDHVFLIMLGGMFVSYLLMFIVYLNGKLEIDTRDPEKDTYRLNVLDFDKLKKRKILILIIDKKAKLNNQQKDYDDYLD